MPSHPSERAETAAQVLTTPRPQPDTPVLEPDTAGPGPFGVSSPGRAPKWFGPAIALITTVAFLPVLANDFVNWDDQTNFVTNDAYRGLAWSNLRWAWTTLHLGAYQPLTWMLCGLEYLLFGMRPWGYHLVSLLFHAGVAVALYSLIVDVMRRARPGSDERVARLAAALAVLSWSVHPLRVEVVAWASCQGYLPCALLAILSVRAYLAAHPETGKTRLGWMVAALVLYLASLLAHATSLGLPLVLLALDFYPLRRFDERASARGAVVEKWPFILLTLIFAALGFAGKSESMPSISRLGPSGWLAQPAYGASFYLVKTCLPFQLRAHYPLPEQVGLAQPVFLAALVGLALLFAAAVMRRKQWPALFVALSAYIAILAPASGLISFGTQITADRYAYPALIPWTVLLADLLVIPLSRSTRSVLIGALVLIVLLGGLTWHQCTTWRDSVRLWSHALRTGDGNDPVVLGNLGVALMGQGCLREGMDYLVRSLQFEPEWARGHFNLGTNYHEQHRLDEAIKHYAEAVRLKPSFVEARHNLAQALMQKGLFPAASDQLAAAVELRPGSAALRHDYGLALAQMGKFQDAAIQLRQAVRLEPAAPRPRLALGRVLAELGRLDEAREQLSQAVRLQPDDAEAHHDLGLILADLGRREEAAVEFRQVLRLEPNHPSARLELEQALREHDNVPRPR